METPTSDAGIYARESAYLDRFVQFGEAGERVISLSFPKTPEADSQDDHPLLDRIEDYLNGAEDDFADVTVGLTVPTDQRTVLEAVREIPYGEDATVEQIARMTPGLSASEQEDLTQVREALAANPVPLLIPDHRVRDGPSAAPPPVEQKLRAVEGR
ncbi:MULTISPECIES: methylated-DNA--[protein]-cysteine S-methyltransferase [Haloarcula]|uniref:Methylated-DNA--protein-cysteine methyltransferase n=1 Tax=Haloarcula pellucida TaxID=1427151 RepID=A0A830GHH4_9EURY|nr:MULTISPECIES: methylated-DNA--[protein]-cysteine S-methyltransferase [Halomicroarcula]MBX0346704.1 methylated-DNA--[protein]-cysteine S-methyltransferase [Halomicroarcula pellucida]MDS0277439.1 methylated-DNA--[protein]-cysteine S-methyltransferase [Halomicroarcula sp. S1AR25-4]QIO22189.1 methylated-DNA--[protein]-cysteine S-methyltransferase [Haloarcula sp. JP-L23]GGN85110.1 methylated-DNA--protein-cysteine methyltransferase [Halomicroarcula pellucida]